MAQLLFLEFNEINLEAVEAYGREGHLPNLTRFIDQYGYQKTTSERRYEELEPWIQWVTAHTGKSLAEHGVFRLGDIVNKEIPQIWEELEQEGLRVGAVSPMNAKNRTRNAAFFVPDPWTATEVSGSGLIKNMYGAIAQAVNDNAEGRLTPASLLWLLAGAGANARFKNYESYMRLAREAGKKPWTKAMFLDLLLADTFITLTHTKKPDFASLFLNAGAHIQHHYMFSSAVYEGAAKNPEWYVSPGTDPVLEVYSLYDRILGQVRERFPKARIMIATGLHQDPHPEITYYWRLRNHAGFLTRIGVPFERVEPRMSRDFLIVCPSADEARRAEQLLESARGDDGVPLFEVDNRGTDLFVMLTYPHEIGEDFGFTVGDYQYEGLKDEVAFVAIKNGQHNGIGYFMDTGAPKQDRSAEFPLAEIPDRVKAAVLGTPSTAGAASPIREGA